MDEKVKNYKRVREEIETLDLQISDLKKKRSDLLLESCSVLKEIQSGKSREDVKSAIVYLKELIHTFVPVPSPKNNPYSRSNKFLPFVRVNLKKNCGELLYSAEVSVLVFPEVNLSLHHSELLLFHGMTLYVSQMQLVSEGRLDYETDIFHEFTTCFPKTI